MKLREAIMSDHDSTRHGSTEHDAEILDEGLARLADTGPEYRGGLSNHGPMAAEALIRLGRADDVPSWLDGYLRRLDAPPRPGDRITNETWRDALGNAKRVADWEAYLSAQLAEEPWRDVLVRWWPRLVPGVAARGLAYWAATYFELPGQRRTAGQLDLTAAVRGLPVRDTVPGYGLITEQLRARLGEDTELPAATAALRPPTDVRSDLRELATTFARAFLVYGRPRPIGLLHAVTAPTAARSVLPLLPAEVARDTYDALWQVDAALYAVYASGATPEPVPEATPPAPEDLADRAVASGDEHAIKLTEACLRLHADHPDPVLLHAAARASDLLGG
jgi:hypothetical protein